MILPSNEIVIVRLRCNSSGSGGHFIYLLLQDLEEQGQIKIYYDDSLCKDELNSYLIKDLSLLVCSYINGNKAVVRADNTDK